MASFTPDKVRVQRLTPEGVPLGEPFEVESVHFGVGPIEARDTPDDWPQGAAGFSIRMRLTKQGRQMIERLVFGRGGPWKAAHARRYQRRR